MRFEATTHNLPGVIRRATPEDVDALAELYERSFATLSFLPALHTIDEHRAWFTRVLLDKEVWAWDEGGVRGFLALSAGLRAAEFGDGSGNEKGVADVRYEWQPEFV